MWSGSRKTAKSSCGGRGDELINGERFFAMEQLCYSDATVQSINRRAIAVFDYLKHAHPTYSDDEIARIMGYTESAIELHPRCRNLSGRGFRGR